ncbi:MAG TPA: acyl-CoA reductase [Chitinophagaceae bacterium]|nr:acyl-CoA reductase [Chitinophagaceae bacterium]
MSDDAELGVAKQNASLQNGWFIPEFVELALRNIAQNFLKKEILESWVSYYHLPPVAETPRTVGIVMAGNVPLVGFHDLLSVFISGHKAVIKTSSKDEVLIKHLVEVMHQFNPETGSLVHFSEMLKNCEVYIATGSNNTSRYFDYYFGKYPHIIRRNKTSVAILEGNETGDDLEGLADDIYQYFGLGCRNVTKIFVPAGYDFEPLLEALRKYNYLADHHKYKNNLDYNLALHILNNKFYMTNGSMILSEDVSDFSPISQINYEYYTNRPSVLSALADNSNVQCIIGHDHIPFGEAQHPGPFDYADKVDTMAFLSTL